MDKSPLSASWKSGHAIAIRRRMGLANMDNIHLSAALFQNDLPDLLARVIALERENAALLTENSHLKKLLTDAGVVITPIPTPLDPHQGARIICAASIVDPPTASIHRRV